MFRLFFQLRYVAGFVMFAASYWGYHLVKVETSDHERCRSTLANELAEQVAYELPLPAESHSISFARLIRDEDNALNGMLRKWLKRHGHRVTDFTLLDQIEQYFVDDAVVRNPVEAQQLAQAEGTQYVVFGEVQRLCTIPESPSLTARLKLYDVEHRAVIFDTVYSVPAESSQSVAMSVRAATNWNSMGDMIVAAAWLLVLATLPIATGRPIVYVLRKRSNGWNAVMLLTYILVVVGSARICWAGEMDDWIAWSLLLVGVPCSAAYFAYICRSLENHGF